MYRLDVSYAIAFAKYHTHCRITRSDHGVACGGQGLHTTYHGCTVIKARAIWSWKGVTSF